MARLSLRDRILTPAVARALLSPSAGLALAVGAGLGLLAGGGLVGAVAGAVVAWAVRVAFAVPRAPVEDRIDPFTLREPWRHYVQDALQARRRFTEAVGSARPGPMRDRLREIEERVETGVREVWRIARRGHDLVEASRRLDPEGVRRELAATEAAAGREPSPDLERAIESRRAQLAAVERLEGVIADADTRLRLLDARLDEAAARTIELSVQAGGLQELGGLGGQVDRLVDEMEALRLALEETGGGGAGRGTTGSGPG